MNRFNPLVLSSALALAVGALLAPSDAAAALTTRTFYSNPAGLCQAALPAYEGTIRKRPLAIQNEGTTPAFVTCAFTSQDNITHVYVYASSLDGAPHPISCTGVSGVAGDPNQYIAKNATVPATGVIFLSWHGSNFAGSPSQFPRPFFSISCSLEPGVGLNHSILFFNEEIGG